MCFADNAIEHEYAQEALQNPLNECCEYERNNNTQYNLIER